jgi:hypothetical protein
MNKHPVSWEHVRETSNRLTESSCFELSERVVYGNDDGSLVVFVKQDGQWFEVREPRKR